MTFLVDQIKKRCREINFEVVDLTGIFDNVSEWVFTDWCHVTNGGNYILAKELVNQVKQRIFQLPLGKDDTLQNPAGLLLWWIMPRMRRS